MSRNKKIVIDCVSLLSNMTGIGKYTYENAKRLTKYPTPYEWYFYYGFFSKNLIDLETDNDAPTIRRLKLIFTKNRIVKKVVRKFLHTLTKFYSPSVDLYWQPNFVPNTEIKTKHLITSVHDFSFHLHEKWHPKERIQYFNQYFWKNVTASDRIITGSNFSKREIIEYLKFDADKIDVIYHGVDHDNFKIYPESILNANTNHLQLPENFILFVGSIEPRKNLINLIKAYHQLDPLLKKDFPLVLVGFNGWNNKEVMREIEQEEANIRYLGYVTNQDLAYIYNLATLFVYPSLYEGFGIPPLEAMACGTPVIVSNTTSMPEVCADAAQYIAPENADEIAEKIELLLTNTRLREEHIQKGLQLAKKYTWDKAAQQHLKVFQKVLEN